MATMLVFGIPGSGGTAIMLSAFALHNVTAGPDLAMDEFATVGEAIGDFASENALVVIGTALDESIKDELRVTVIAHRADPPLVGPPRSPIAPQQAVDGSQLRSEPIFGKPGPTKLPYPTSGASGVNPYATTYTT